MARIRLVDGPAEPKFRSKRLLSLIVFSVVLAFMLLFNPLRRNTTPRDSRQELLALESEPSSTWPKWGDTKRMVVFGDSITSTHFRWRREQPSEANPLGNPSFPGNTSAIGMNWIGHLTASYNETSIKTLNLASGGATVDNDIIPPMFDSVKSFKYQVERWWLEHYVPSSSKFDWTSEDTLFVAFLGSNDVTRAYLNGWGPALDADVKQYVDILETLYQNGARHFLILNVPPFDRSPMLEWEGASARRRLGELVEGYNRNLGQRVSQFKREHPDATVFQFDTWALFNQLLDNPCDMAETCALQETTTYCQEFFEEREDAFRSDPNCPYSLDKYFWLNTLHPSFRVHDAMAKSILAYMKSFD